MNRQEWKRQDGAYRRMRDAEAYRDFGRQSIVPTKGRDLGRRHTQEQRLATLRDFGLRNLRRPDDAPMHPEVVAVLHRLGKTPFRHTRAWARADYRNQVRGTLANSGFAAHWMIEQSVRCIIASRQAVRAWRMAA